MKTDEWAALPRSRRESVLFGIRSEIRRVQTILDHCLEMELYHAAEEVDLDRKALQLAADLLEELGRGSDG